MHDSVLAWKEVRLQRDYDAVATSATEWLAELWPDARKLALTPDRPKISTYRAKPPRIVISDKVDRECIGVYWAHDHAHGPLIKIVPSERMRTGAREYGDGLLRNLRWTILHEVQHALDDRHGVWSADHDRWYERRLRRMVTVFPTTTLKP